MITSKYTEKGAFVQTDLRMCFLKSKCPDKSNVRQFLDELCMKWEELATVGVDIDKKDYCSTIIFSLPYFFAGFASNQLAAVKLYSSTKTITPDTLILLISKEYECQQMQCSHQNSGNEKAKNQDCDKALSVMSSEKSNRKGRFERKPRGVCWNCGDKGYFKDKCPKPVTDKKNDSSKSKGSTANTTIGSDSEDEGAFFMEPAFGSDSNSDSNGSNDGGYDSNNNGWFSERGSNRAGSDWETEELSGVDESECDSLINIDLDLVVATEPDELAALVGVGKVNLPHAEIYDSGCSKHLMLYHDALENFIEISPKTFQAANKQTISAIGMGEMMIDIPNGADISQLRLTEVLYSPEVSYTLVSVSQLDEKKKKSFEITFSGGKCSIKEPDRKHVGAVPKTEGLYCVAHVVDEALTLDQFHCCMGYILAGVTCCLIDNSFVTSVHLEPKSSGELFFCESCMYAKAT